MRRCLTAALACTHDGAVVHVESLLLGVGGDVGEQRHKVGHGLDRPPDLRSVRVGVLCLRVASAATGELLERHRLLAVQHVLQVALRLAEVAPFSAAATSRMFLKCTRASARARAVLAESYPARTDLLWSMEKRGIAWVWGR